jgi:hypothetical protein
MKKLFGPITAAESQARNLKFVKYFFVPFAIIMTVVIFGHTEISKFFGIRDYLYEMENPSGNSSKSSTVNVFNEAAVIGVPWKHNFAPELIALLDPKGAASPAIYSFYLGSGVGFPPMGLTLGIDGVLSGTPKGSGGNFEVCVKDVGGRSVCKAYRVNTVAQSKSTPASTKNSSECNPVNDCDDYVHCPTCPVPLEVRRNENCQCPRGTTDVGVDTVWLEINGKLESARKRICAC